MKNRFNEIELCFRAGAMLAPDQEPQGHFHLIRYLVREAIAVRQLPSPEAITTNVSAHYVYGGPCLVTESVSCFKH